MEFIDSDARVNEVERVNEAERVNDIEREEEWENRDDDDDVDQWDNDKDDIDNDDQTKAGKVRKWMRKNLGALGEVGVAITGIIATVVVLGRRALSTSAKALAGVAKGVAGLAKGLGPMFGSVFKILGTTLGFGAKGLKFLAENMWLVAVVLTFVVYKMM